MNPVIGAPKMLVTGAVRTKKLETLPKTNYKGLPRVEQEASRRVGPEKGKIPFIFAGFVQESHVRILAEGSRREERGRLPGRFPGCRGRRESLPARTHRRSYP